MISAGFLGQLLGALLFGWIAERYGRMTAMVWSIALANILGAGLCYAFSPQFARLATLRYTLILPAVLSIVYIGAFEASRSWGDLFALLRREAGPVVVHHHAHHAAIRLVPRALQVPRLLHLVDDAARPPLGHAQARGELVEERPHVGAGPVVEPAYGHVDPLARQRPRDLEPAQVAIRQYVDQQRRFVGEADLVEVDGEAV